MQLPRLVGVLLASFMLPTENVLAQPSDASNLSARFEAAALDYCAPFVEAGGEFLRPTVIRGYSVTPAIGLPPGHRARPVPQAINSAVIVGDADATTFVTIVAEIRGGFEPFCSVSANGVDAAAAIQALVAHLQSGNSGWTLAEDMPGRTRGLLTFFQDRLSDSAWGLEMIVASGQSPQPNFVVASISRMPVWRQEDHPEDPTPEEIEAARTLNLTQAFELAAFDVAIPLLLNTQNYDPVLARRV